MIWYDNLLIKSFRVRCVGIPNKIDAHARSFQSRFQPGLFSTTIISPRLLHMFRRSTRANRETF